MIEEINRKEIEKLAKKHRRQFQKLDLQNPVAVTGQW